MKILTIQNRMGIGDMIIFLPYIEAIAKKFNTQVYLLVKESSKADQYLKNSDYIDEPYKGLNPSRSRSAEYSVFSGVCTHLGCAPKYFPEVEPKPWDATWSGGFFCPCHGSMFDIVGRVFKGVPAPTNLVVPPHMFEGSILTIGEDKEL